MRRDTLNYVLFLTQGASDRLPSRRLRVIKILPFLQGISCGLDVAPKNFLHVFALLPKIIKSQKIFVQKELVPISFLWLLKLLGRTLIFDFDDAIHLRQLSAGGYRYSRKRQARFQRICKFADVLVAGNEYLEKIAILNGAKNVVVIPTGVELPAVLKSQHEKVPNLLTLGWIGTRVNLPFLESWEPIFNRLNKSGIKFNLKVMSSNRPNFINFHSYEFVEWSDFEQSKFLDSIDIGLMPLKNNEYTAGKCAYKALQYLSYGKVVIASDVGVNSSWLGKSAFVSNSSDDIFDAIKRLSSDEELRKEMGSVGRNLIENRFNIEVIASRVRELILQS